MQTCLITGASRGIGLELTEQALALGYRVIATCRDPSTADALSALSGSLDVHALDVTNESATTVLAEHLSGLALDILINNAGMMSSRQSIGDMDYEQWMTSFAVNAIAPWRMSVAFCRHSRSLSPAESSHPDKPDGLSGTSRC